MKRSSNGKINNNKYMIIQCNRSYEDYVKFAMSLITSTNKGVTNNNRSNHEKIIVNPIYTSGTLNKIKSIINQKIRQQKAV